MQLVDVVLQQVGAVLNKHNSRMEAAVASFVLCGPGREWRHLCATPSCEIVVVTCEDPLLRVRACCGFVGRRFCIGGSVCLLSALLCAAPFLVFPPRIVLAAVLFCVHFKSLGTFYWGLAASSMARPSWCPGLTRDMHINE